MKKRMLALLLLTVMVMLTLASCAGAPGEGGADFMGAAPGSPSKSPSHGDTDDTTTDGEDKVPEEQPVTIPAGQLTAAEWNDIEHFEDWLKLFEDYQDTERNGLFLPYAQSDKVWGLPYRYMLPVSVKNGTTPIFGATVELLGDDGELFSAVTDAKGMAYLFTYEAYGEGNTLRVSLGAETKEIPLDETSLAGGAVAVEFSAVPQRQNVIELMFVIDTTGSMSDELSYIKAEVDDVIARVKESNPGVTVRLALMFYRDKGDEYVTRYFDFTEDIEAQRENLAKQKSVGGGDYPEAVHTAIEEAVAKQWSSGNTTKLLFHILDAPPHDIAEDAATYREAIFSAAEKGIRIIPVASSGVNKETEYLLRSEALLTGGTYTFLTDDSGIGNSHLEPTVGQYTVEFLNSMLVRLICEFYTGEDISPVDWRQEVK